MRNEYVIKVFFVLITIISFLFAFVEQFGLSDYCNGLVISWEWVSVVITRIRSEEW